MALSPCVPADSTGTHSLYTVYQDHEIMFHVSTMLPYTPNNQQQVCGAGWGVRDLRGTREGCCGDGNLGASA